MFEGHFVPTMNRIEKAIRFEAINNEPVKLEWPAKLTSGFIGIAARPMRSA